MRLVIVTTAHETLGAFFAGQAAFLASQGFEVHAVSSPGAGLDKLGRIPGVATHAIAMRRPPHPLGDLVSLIALGTLMLRLRPRIVHAHTPKAGLLGMLAAALARVPVRLSPSMVCRFSPAADGGANSWSLPSGWPALCRRAPTASAPRSNRS